MAPIHGTGTKLRVGVIGLGFGQAVTVPVFQAHSQTQVVAITSARPEKAQSLLGELGVPKAYGNWREMIQTEHLDIVAVATPADVQVDILEFLLSLPKPPAVFAEKPFTVNLEQAEKLYKQWQSKQTPVVLDFEFPQIPQWQQFHQIAQLELKSDSKINVRWQMQNYANKNRLENWKTRVSQGGGVLHAFGSHIFYNLEWFFQPIVRLKSRLSKTLQDPRETYSIWSADAELANGARVSIEISSDNSQETVHSFELLNGKTSWRLENRTADYVNGFLVFKDVDVVPTPKTQLPDWQKGFAETLDGRKFAVSFLIDKMVRYLNGEKVNDLPGIDAGLRVQKLMEIAMESHRRDGEWVNV